jgi:hypothetical protein
MRNKAMGAFAPVLLVAILAVSILGGAMALWWERLNIDVNVETGTLDASLSVHDFGDNEIPLAVQAGESDPSVKDVSNITCTLSPDANSIDIQVNNAYPGITYYCTINLENTGTIPFKVYSVNLTGNLTDVMTSDSGFVNGSIYEGLQMHPGDVVYDTLQITLTNDAAENATYTATLEIVVEQWNEYPTAPPSP